MKIRWTHDSVRLRITPPELSCLLGGGVVREGLALPGSSADTGTWVAELSANSPAGGLAYEAGTLHLSLSGEQLRQLAEPASEGVYFKLGGGAPEREFRYFVEKDFPCAHPRAAETAEPPAETFEAPAGFEQRKQQRDNA